jgi:hypothetical protein
MIMAKTVAKEYAHLKMMSKLNWNITAPYFVSTGITN